MQNTLITTEKQLRSIIPPHNKMLDKRIQNQLDQLSFEYIEATRICAIYGNNEINYVPWNTNTIKVHGPKEFSIFLNDESLVASPTIEHASLYLLIPGIDHGLRINGTLRINQSRLHIHIASLYFQCARAATRANLWHSPSDSHLCDEEANPYVFLHKARYCLLGTKNKQGQTELSPRGEAYQCIHALDSSQVLLAERPGNKVAISLRNILENDHVCISLLNTGFNQSLNIQGRASLITHSDKLAPLAVDNKIPKIGILIEVEQQELRPCPSFVQQSMWDPNHYITAQEITSFSKAINQHMNGQGLISKATQPIVSSVIQADMKQLY